MKILHILAEMANTAFVAAVASAKQLAQGVQLQTDYYGLDCDLHCVGVWRNVWGTGIPMLLYQ